MKQVIMRSILLYWKVNVFLVNFSWTIRTLGDLTDRFVIEGKMKMLFILPRGGAFLQFGNGLGPRTTSIGHASREKSLSLFRIVMVSPLIEKAEFFIRKENSSAKTSGKLIIFLVDYASFHDSQHYILLAITFIKTKT